MSVFKNIYLEHITKMQEEHDKEVRGTSATIYNGCYTAVVNTFKWGNLPKTTLRFLPERHLFFYGRMAFFKEGDKYMLLPCTPAGSLLENGEYTQYMCYTLNGVTYLKKREEIAICYNNCRALPSYFFVGELAEKMSYSLSVVDCALRKASMPSIIEVNSPDQFNTLSELMNKDVNLQPFKVTLSQALSENQSKIHNIFDNREVDVLALWDIYVRYRNLFYTEFGINNVEIQKRERLTEAEGSGNDEITRFTLLDDMYESRTEFIKEVKEKFGYELTLEINRNSSTIYEIMTSNEEKVEQVIIENTKGANLPTGGGENEDTVDTE